MKSCNKCHLPLFIKNNGTTVVADKTYQTLAYYCSNPNCRNFNLELDSETHEVTA